MCFSITDQRHNPYYAAAELARWADVLLIAPMCPATLTAIATGREDDLLLEVVQVRAAAHAPPCTRTAIQSPCITPRRLSPPPALPRRPV